MDKFSELKASAMAATPGPWILDDDSWSEGDNANISTEERYDSGIINIAQVDGGGSESGFDEPFSTEQQANARFIAAANPAVVLELLAERDADKKRIAELEAGHQEAAKQIASWRRIAKQNIEEREKDLAALDAERQKITGLEAKLATPIQIVNYDEFFICHVSGASDDYCKGWVDGRNAAARDVGKAGFTVEDKQ